VRKYPEQWQWVRRRWKTRPPQSHPFAENAKGWATRAKGWATGRLLSVMQERFVASSEAAAIVLEGRGRNRRIAEAWVALDVG
jgi:hypothetical protein